MDHSINRPGNKVTTVTKENSNAMDERPHYVQMKESATLSRGHFTNKPHLTEPVFLCPFAHPLSPCSNPFSFLLSGCLEELWRSGERLWSEEWAWGFDLWLAPAALAALSHRDGAVSPTERALRCEEADDKWAAAQLWQKKSCAEVARHNGTVWEEEVRRAQSPT